MLIKKQTMKLKKKILRVLLTITAIIVCAFIAYIFIAFSTLELNFKIYEPSSRLFIIFVGFVGGITLSDYHEYWIKK